MSQYIDLRKSFSAVQKTRIVVIAGLLAFAALAYWSVRHVTAIIQTSHGEAAGQFALIYGIAFFFLVWQTLLSYLERPIKASEAEMQRLDKKKVVCAVPVYNEAPEALRECLRSLINQYRPINLIYVVDDGSKVDYAEIQEWFLTQCKINGIEGKWARQKNAGKRHAQGLVFGDTPDADLYLTVDSDSQLDYLAVQEVIKPFKSRKVKSVAGIVLAANVNKNFLSRFTDLWFVTGQLVDRSAMSRLGSVLVNSGPIAMYDAMTIRQYLDGYLNETFFGRRVEFSDDSMLTIYCLLHGKAVQQPSAFSFSLMPEDLKHHVNQQLRWMRGAFIRSWWRFKYLPLNRYAYWAHFIGWIQWVLASVVFVAVFIVEPAINPAVLPYLFTIPLLVGYGQALRYLTVKRSDVSFWQQFATYLGAPVATFWSYLVLRPIRWYSMVTCLNTGWKTRQEVETLTF